MARKRKDTFFYDMARDAVLKILVGLSKEGLTPDIGPGNFPAFQVYPSRVEGYDLSCDLAPMLAKTMQEKQEMAALIIKRLGNAWANSPFTEIAQTGPGFIHFKIPASATKR